MYDARLRQLCLHFFNSFLRNNAGWQRKVARAQREVKGVERHILLDVQLPRYLPSAPGLPPLHESHLRQDDACLEARHCRKEVRVARDGVEAVEHQGAVSGVGEHEEVVQGMRAPYRRRASVVARWVLCTRTGATR